VKITTVPTECSRDPTSHLRQNASAMQPLLHFIQFVLAEIGLESRIKTSGSKPSRLVKAKASHRWYSSQVKE